MLATKRSHPSKISLVLLMLTASAMVGLAAGLLGEILLWSTLIGIGLVIVLVRLPELPLIILVMGMPIWGFFSDELVAGLAIPLTLLFALLALLVQNLKRSPNKGLLTFFAPNAADFWFGFFVLWLWVALLWTPDNVYGLYKALGFTANSFIAYVLVRWAFRVTDFNLIRLAILMSVVGLGHAVAVLYASYLTASWRPDVLDPSFMWIIREWGLNPIDEADALALSLLATALLFFQLNRSRWVMLPVYLFQLWAFMRFQQRGASLALIAGMVFMVFILARGTNRDRIRRFVSLKYSVLFLPLLFLIGYLMYSFNPRVETAYLREDVNVTTRLEYYRSGLTLFQESFWLGVGTGGTGVTLSGTMNLGQRFYVHNRVIEVMAELGLIGLSLLIGLTIVLAKHFKYAVTHTTKSHLFFGVALAGSCLFVRYIVGMTSDDLVGWDIGLWAGLIVSIFQQVVGTQVNKEGNRLA